MSQWRSARISAAVLLLLAILVTAPGHPLAHHTGCYYDPSDSHAYGCSETEMDMLMMMAWAEAASAQNRQALADQWRRNAQNLPGEGEAVRVNPRERVAHYQVLDSQWVGDNVKFVTLPSGRGHQLVIQDRREREVKIAGKWTHGRVSAYSAWWLTVVGGILGGQGLAAWTTAAVGVSANSAVIGWAGLGHAVGWAYVMDALPSVGETEYLVHLLHPVDGGEQVYRANIRVKADGRIQVKAPWRFLGYRTPGGDW